MSLVVAVMGPCLVGWKVMVGVWESPRATGCVGRGASGPMTPVKAPPACWACVEALTIPIQLRHARPTRSGARTKVRDNELGNTREFAWTVDMAPPEITVEAAPQVREDLVGS